MVLCQVEFVKNFTSTRLVPHELRSICDKVVAAERINDDEAARLYHSTDINALGLIANIVRERKNGNRATFILNRYINYSNVCILSCQFCAFGARKRDPHAFELAIPEIIETTRQSLHLGITEVHMVGGLHPTLTGEWYLKLLRGLRALDPGLHIKAFTAIEVRHLAERIFKAPIRETLQTLRDAGLNSLTGGGAEIFDPIVRDKICRGKETAEEWKEVHRLWHEMGGRSTCTMLFGHIETIEHRVDHLRQLRGLQDETGGFTGFVPFAFVPETTELKHIKPASGLDQLRNLAVSRIYLDNFDHITGYWIAMTLPLAQISARDVDGGKDLPYGWLEDAPRANESDSGTHHPGSWTRTDATRQLLPAHSSEPAVAAGSCGCSLVFSPRNTSYFGDGTLARRKGPSQGRASSRFPLFAL